MTAYGSDWRPEDSPFYSDESGWESGCRSEDEPWVSEYGFLPSAAVIDNPIDALPSGYAAYTAVLHSLEDPDSEGRLKWVIDPTGDPWGQVQRIVDHGVGSWRIASDNDIAQPEGRVIADALGLDSEDAPLTVSFFFPAWVGTVRAATVAARLRTANHNLGYCPTFWFPHTRAWAASDPADTGWTYIASNAEVAGRLLDDPLIEALPCTYCTT